MRMLTVAAAVLVAGAISAQPTGFGFGGGQGPSGLVMNKAVQEDLKMTEEQVTKAAEWAKGFFAKRQEIFKDKGIELGKGGGGGGGFGKGLDPETMAKFAAANAEVDKAAYKELETVLKPDQVKRLKQIQVQARGVSAFQNADIAKDLKLTDDQKKAVTDISADLQRELMEMGQDFFGGGFDQEKMTEFQKKSQELQKKTFEKVTAKLTDDQKKTWKEMTGAPFDTAKLVPVFGKKKD